MLNILQLIIASNGNNALIGSTRVDLLVLLALGPPNDEDEDDQDKDDEGEICNKVEG